MTKPRLLVLAVLAAAVAAVPVLAAVGSERDEVSTSDLSFIGGVIQLIQHDYVHPIGAGELTKDALKGMLTRLDPHSDYMDEQEFKQSLGSISGKFGGLGMEVAEQDGVPKVISPIDGTPAARAGIQPGDLIVLIDHQSTQGMDLDKAVSMLRGDPGTTVNLTISRGEKNAFDVTLTRQIIQVQSVKSSLESNGFGYVRITQFSDDTPKSFRQAVSDLKQKSGGQLRGLVVDLRNDPGGLLSAAVDVAGDLLDGGTVVSIHGRQSGDDQSYAAPARGDMLPGTPVAVLINGASASASEIVAGALQDRHRATVMGTQSFGKGSVQSIIPLKGHGAVRLTTALYYTPAWRSIQDEGVSPDVVVEVPKDEQVPGAVVLRESALHGAFANPGPLGQDGAKTRAPQAAVAGKTASSPLIKADLIGSPQDAQLKAALSYLQRTARAGN
jgi:carboxyl-terminal processing protease